MPRKTIIKKLPTVDNTAPKRRGRPRKVEQKMDTPIVSIEEIKEEKETQPVVEKIQKRKVAKRKIKEIRNEAPENVAYLDFLRQENTDLKNLVEKHAKAMEKVKVAQTKFRTKYMQLEHERQTWNKTKIELLNVVSQLRSLAMQYAPLDEVFDIANKITEISKRDNTGRKPLLMPE